LRLIPLVVLTGGIFAIDYFCQLIGRSDSQSNHSINQTVACYRETVVISLYTVIKIGVFTESVGNSSIGIYPRRDIKLGINR
jgi:hypothetical protein